MRTDMKTFEGWMDDGDEADGVALVGFDLPRAHEVRFRAAFVEYKRQGDDGVLLRGTMLEKLLMQQGDSIGLLPLTGLPHKPALY